MNFKTSMRNSMIAMAAVCLLSACNGNQKEKEPEAPAKTEAKANAGLKIAFVQLDTLTNQYQYFIDLNDAFSKKQANAESTINQKRNSFANQVQEFQRKASSNQYTQEQFNNEQARLAKLEQDVQELTGRLSASLQEEQAKELQNITDTIQHFMSSYAKEKGYDYILCKSSGIDQVLYADPAYDVTDEIVKALNKRYENDKKKAPAKDKK